MKAGGIGALVRAGFAACVAWSLSAECLGRSITIEDFDAAIDVETSGSFEVTETIRLRFEGAWNGIHRRIPVVFKSAQGYDYNLRLTLASVTDETGSALRYEGSRDRHYDSLKIFIPGAADASRTVVIRYSVRRGLRFFPDHDELYWNATGDEWAFPILAARARITLPRELVNVRANGFTGGFGVRERAVSIRVDGILQSPDDGFIPAGESPPPDGDRHVVEIESLRPLGIREGLTAAVAWNPGIVHRPGWVETQFAWLRDNFALASLVVGLCAAPLAACGVMATRWWKHGRDPRPGPVVVQYAPPEGLGPAEVGTLVDNSPDTRDLMAILVDLAVKGYVRIRETTKAGWLSRAKYTFDLLVPESAWKDLPASERTFLEGLFPYRTGTREGAGTAGIEPVSSVTSDALQDRFYEHLPAIRSAIFAGLVDGGHYIERPDHVRSRYVAAAVGLGVGIVAATFAINAFLLKAHEWTTIPLAVFSALITTLVVAGFGLVMPARTKKGAETRNGIRGFMEFLSRVDTHRLASMPLTPDLFEKYLPFAMALGVEGRWSKAFEGICKEPPQWYAGSGPIVDFRTDSLTADLSRMTAVTAAAMQSSPRSSEGSAFGGGSSGGGGFSDGGGFSGGGFGGGGGDGF